MGGFALKYTGWLTVALWQWSARPNGCEFDHGSYGSIFVRGSGLSLTLVELYDQQLPSSRGLSYHLFDSVGRTNIEYSKTSFLYSTAEAHLSCVHYRMKLYKSIARSISEKNISFGKLFPHCPNLCIPFYLANW